MSSGNTLLDLNLSQKTGFIRRTFWNKIWRQRRLIRQLLVTFNPLKDKLVRGLFEETKGKSFVGLVKGSSTKTTRKLGQHKHRQKGFGDDKNVAPRMKEVIPGGEKDGWRYFEVEVKVIDVFSELFETFYFSTDLENFRTFQIP